jgi:hypothetical protein
MLDSMREGLQKHEDTTFLVRLTSEIVDPEFLGDHAVKIHILIPTLIVLRYINTAFL